MTHNDVHVICQYVFSGNKNNFRNPSLTGWMEFSNFISRPSTDVNRNCRIEPNILNVDLEPFGTFETGNSIFEILSENIWSQEECLAADCGIGTEYYSSYLKYCPKTCLLKVDNDY